MLIGKRFGEDGKISYFACVLSDIFRAPASRKQGYPYFMTWALCYPSPLFDEISILVGSCAAVLG